MTPPLVLNTRPRDQAADLTRHLRAAGFDVLESPTIEIVPRWDPARVQAARTALHSGAYAWLVLPSPNAARYLLQALGEVGPSSSRGPGGVSPQREKHLPFPGEGAGDGEPPKILCGSGTAATIEEMGLTPHRILPRFSAAAALASLANEEIAGGVLVPRAAEGRDELIDGLRARDVRVDVLDLYETRPVAPVTLRETAALLIAGRLAAVTFSSPSTVRGLVQGLEALGHRPMEVLGPTPIACIGATTVEAVRQAGLPAPVAAEETTIASLADAVRRAVAGVPA